MGGHRRRDRRIHPTPSEPHRTVRRDRLEPHGPKLQRLSRRSHIPPTTRTTRTEHMADVTLPQLGETVTEGTITQWFKNVGDAIAEDEPLFEVSTDKVDTEVPSPVSGVVTELLAEEGDTVDVGVVIAIVSVDGAAPAAATPPAPEPAAAPTPAAAAAPAPTPAPAPPPAPAPAPAPVSSAPAAADGDSRLLSPVVRRLVSDHGLDPAAITGTGPGGRITRDDVLDHIDAVGSTPQTAAAPTAAPSAAMSSAPPPTAAPDAAPASVVAAADGDATVKLSKIRKLTGDHMVASKATSPHAFSVVEVDFANVDVVRNAVKADWKQRNGFSLTYLPFISRAIVDGIREFPHMNASVGGDELIVHDAIDLGIAVDLDYEGLLAPVIRAADSKRLGAIATEISDLANRARNRKLSPDEISGGTFTISNNGSAGSVLTMPIINQPQVAIISTDAIVRKPVVTTGSDGGEAIAIHPVGNLAMSWDHRAFDGAYAAGFLKRVKEILETKDWSTEL
ncbi:MAG: 2-oxoglutarate dehydrogenase, E2 component, dihydrolipoamide succinyltransferase [Acidimicrobiia bacterium]|nr:2-oxoglutarate dehydrogenase, E2 component, dihydrolipoamide succinyltransferase [Acidimicrobiia bacterium]